MEDFSAQEDTAKTKGSVEQQLCSGTVSDKGEEATAPASECFSAEALEMATSFASVEFSSKNSEMPLGNVKGAPENIETPGPVEDTNRSVRKVDLEGGELDSSPALQERRCQRGVEVTAGSLGNMLYDNLLKQEDVQGTACKFVSGDGVGQEEIRYCHSVENSSPPNMNKSDEAVSGSCPENGELDRTHGYGSPCNHSPDPDMMVNVSVKSDAVLSNTIETELIGLPIEVISSIDLEQMEVHGDSLVNEQLQDKGSSRDTFGLQPKICDKNSQESGKRANRTPKSTKKKRLGRSLLCSDRVLRSKSKDKSKAEVNEEVLNPNTGGEIKRRGRKKNRAFKATDNEFSKIRKKLYYMLNRIRYEKSLIDAYTGEGWKGLSLEKIKPERELQRATSEIVKRKSRIRDLFQHLDSLCTEGRLPEALFDSEGMIDSEDIFCAKCGSKDLTADNDIILCDGACDRGFHQRCLEPPLLKEDIPPGDEGWLCPACDCKVDCMELLNESQGTNLLISDSWERIFPEVATDRNAEDSNFGLPSDDSEDMDYDPDAPQNDEELQGDDSGSEESGNATLTDEAHFKDKNCLGLPSDDSEDDEFDPDAPDLENAEEASSSSDFTSDSEDLTVMLGDVPLEDGGAGSSLVDRQNSQRGGSRRSYKKGSRKEETIGDELQSLLDEDSGKDATVLSGKRHVERLDYKKLYDEQYANNSSDSSDDGDWTDNVASGKRKRGVKKGFSTQIGNSTSVVDMKQKRNEADLTPRRKSNRLNATNSSSPAAPLQKSSSTSRSTGDRAPSSSSRRLGETVTQRLYEAFKENHYPDQSMREKLAEELGITSKQVRKWFENARWSFHHPSARKATVSASDARNKSSVPQTNMKQHMVASEITTKDSTRNGIQTAEPHGSASMPGCTNKDARENKLGRKQTIRKRYNRSNPGKRMERVDDCVSSLDEKKQVHTTGDGSAKISEAQISNRRQTGRKSAT